MTRRRANVLAVLALLAICILPSAVGAGDETCYPIPADEWAPAGVAGCTLDGPTTGRASTWAGPVAAANWCTHAVRDTIGCGAWSVRSLQTGISIIIQPAEFCHCWWETDRRLVDLTHGQVEALGLNVEAGIFDVVVGPAREKLLLPNTAARP